MSAVVDANIAAALVISLPYSEAARRKMSAWRQEGRPLYAPLLFEYELATVVRRSVVIGQITPVDAQEALRELLALDIQRISPTADLHERALRWAERLHQSKAYDAHYLALAEQLGIEFWTADQRLVNNVRQTGVTWVHWIEEQPAGP